MEIALTKEDTGTDKNDRGMWWLRRRGEMARIRYEYMVAGKHDRSLRWWDLMAKNGVYDGC